MNEFRIEVGKTYKTRNGFKVVITDRPAKNRFFPFEGKITKDGSTYVYSEDGRWSTTPDCPFDLVEEVKEEIPEMNIDINKKYQTRDGRPVELISNRGRTDYNIAGYIDDQQYITFWTNIHSSNCSLVLVPVKKTGYINVYEDSNPEASRSVFPTLCQAIKDTILVKRKYVKTVKVTWEE